MIEHRKRRRSYGLEELKRTQQARRVKTERSKPFESIKANVGKKSRLIDPIEYALSIHDDVLEDYTPTFAWERETPTARQMAVLGKMKFDPNTITSRGYASMLLNRIIGRRAANLATPSQIKTLKNTAIRTFRIQFKQLPSAFPR